jgi:myo-inositol 2-dehydrogenase / D-chiro-inositol 1-dehydrogenase
MNINRRHFVAGVALAAYGQAEPRVGTGVIGVGNRGSHLLNGVMEEPRAKVVALCDIKPDRLDKAATAAAKDNPSAYSDWRKVIDRKDIDSVFIATPPYLHAEMAVAALEAGKHVYCEKPIGITPAQVASVVKAARASKKVFVPGQQLRSMKQLGDAIRQIHEGVIGDILMVKAQREASSDLPYDGSSGDWYYDVSKSGGYLIEQSVHNLDLCNWVLGAHPTRAAGFGAIVLHKNEPPGRTIFDCGTLSYDYPKGIKMSFTQSVFKPGSMPGGSQYVYVFGSKGSVDLMGGTTMYSFTKGVAPVVLSPKVDEPQHAHITAYYEAITKGGPLPADITIGATAALTAILGHEAMTREKVVTWADLGVDV